MLLFLRADHLVPLAAPAEYVDGVDTSKLTLLHFVRDEAVYEMYDDDGISRGETLDGHMTEIRVTKDGGIRVNGAASSECRLNNRSAFGKDEK